MFLLQPRLRWVGQMHNINILKWNRKEKQEYLQEIERIRSEIAGFQPIANKEDTWKLRHDDESVESDCEELGGPEEFF